MADLSSEVRLRSVIRGKRLFGAERWQHVMRNSILFPTTAAGGIVLVHPTTIARKQHPIGRGPVTGATSNASEQHDQLQDEAVASADASTSRKEAKQPSGTDASKDAVLSGDTAKGGAGLDGIGNLADVIEGEAYAGSAATDAPALRQPNSHLDAAVLSAQLAEYSTAGLLPDALPQNEHALTNGADIAFSHHDASTASEQPGQAILDAQAVQAQVEALIKSNLDLAAPGTSLADIVAAAAAAASANDDSDEQSSRFSLTTAFGDVPSAGDATPVSVAGGARDKDIEANQEVLPFASAELAGSEPGTSTVDHVDIPIQSDVAIPEANGSARGTKRSRAEVETDQKSQRLHLDDDATARLLKELEAVANAAAAASVAAAPSDVQQTGGSSSSPTSTASGGGDLSYAPVTQHPHLDAVAAAAAASTAGSSNHVHSYQNTFAQYQYPQNHQLAFKEAVRSDSAEATKYEGSRSGSNAPTASDEVRRETSSGMTREEEERAADALLQDIDVVNAADGAATADAANEVQNAIKTDDAEESPVGDLAAAAQAAMGLDNDGNPLPGNEESHRALAEAVKRLSAQHEQAVQQAASAAAAAAAEAAAAAASKAAAAEALYASEPPSGGASASSSTAATAAATSASAATAGSPKVANGSGRSPASRGNGNPPAKRFQCPKCERAFARAFNLNTHLATHDPDPSRSKPYPCPYPSCKSEGGRSFSRKHDLQRHVASVHEFEPEPGINGDPGEINGDTGGLASLGLGTPGKKFRCEACGRSFVRRDACNRHQCTRKRDSRTEDGSAGAEGSISPAPGISPALGISPTPAINTAPAISPAGSSISPAPSVSPAIKSLPREAPRPATVFVSGNPVSLYHSGPAKEIGIKATSASARPSVAATATKLPTPPVAAGASTAASAAGTASAHATGVWQSTTPIRNPTPIPRSAPASSSAPVAATRPATPAVPAAHAAPGHNRAGLPTAPTPPVAPVVEAVATREQAEDDEPPLNAEFSKEVQDIGRQLLAQARAQDRALSSTFRQESASQQQSNPTPSASQAKVPTTEPRQAQQGAGGNASRAVPQNSAAQPPVAAHAAAATPPPAKPIEHAPVPASTTVPAQRPSSTPSTALSAAEQPTPLAAAAQTASNDANGASLFTPSTLKLETA
ncbi:hypothetical protein ACQY0O_008002 [Thecaphora frezii]